MRSLAAAIVLVVVACSAKIINPLRCVASQACFDCLETKCSAELLAAEHACDEFLQCRQRSCTDTNCSIKAGVDCDEANTSLAQCEKTCAMCPGNPTSN